MTSPSTNSFSLLVVISGWMFVMWHTWHYDHFRCLIPTRQNWFTAIMCHVLILSIAFFFVGIGIQVHISYKEFYIELLGTVQPAPWQVWSEHYQQLWRRSIYVFCAGWVCLQAVHLEEFLYWSYLITSIRSPGGPNRTWLGSHYFKVFVGSVITGCALLFAALQIETTNLDMMRAYLFCVGGVMSCCLAIGSVVLCVVFPSFIRSVKAMGATFEVLERLSFFKELNEIRTVFRLIYALAFTILAADGLSKTQRINRSSFGADFCYCLGELALFISTCLSVIILLPRNMDAESQPSKVGGLAEAGAGSQEGNFHPMVPYKRPLPSPHSSKGNAHPSTPHFMELGERLNIERETMAAGLLAPVIEEHEMSPTSPSTRWRQQDDEAPFADVIDRSRRARMSEMTNLPRAIQKFKSPIDVGMPQIQGPPQVLVTTSHQVVRDDEI